MRLTVFRASGLDHLATELGALLAAHPPGVFDAETVLVPTFGTGRWLAQRLSHDLGGSGRGNGDGITAGVTFLAPPHLADLLGGADADPWHPDRLAWSVLAVIDAAAGQDWLGPIATHLAPGNEHRRYALARRIAGLFAAYSRGRPTLVRDWLAGTASDGAGGPIPADLTWQMALLVRVAHHIGSSPPALGVAGAATGLAPGRVHLFGFRRLAAADAAVLSALAAHHDLRLWITDPSPAQWAALGPALGSALGAAPHGDGNLVLPRADFPTPDDVRHPLLRTLGAEARELQTLLTAAGIAPPSPVEDGPVEDGPVEDAPAAESAAAAAAGPSPDGPTLLQALQVDIRGNRVPERGGQADRSIQVHACHGPSRQVEALREVLTSLFEDDQTLQPRDVLIMCPDIDTYAPLFHATFGYLGTDDPAHPGHSFRLSLTDRSRAVTNPLLDLALALVNFTGGRLRASELLDLIHRPEVSRRFGLSAEDIDTLATWIADTGIRWGMNTGSRVPFRVALGSGTIEFGLARLLTGVTMAEDGRDVAGVLPLDEVGSTQIHLAGVFAELCSRLATGLDRLGAAATVAEWTDALSETAEALAEPEHEWQRSSFARDLARLALAGDAPATRADLRRVLVDLTTPRPSAANLRTGALSVTPLGPLRGVPHKVICLVGMDDGTFPRSLRLDGDDVLARTPLVGERDTRIEDRGLFLDAVLAAKRNLIITYTSHGSQRGEERHPAIPVAELLDVVAAYTGNRNGLITEHPLHPFDSRYFAADRPEADRDLVSFDRASAQAALSTAAQTRETRAPVRTGPAFVAEPLPPVPATDVSLDELRNFFSDPVRAFLRDRLEVTVSEDADAIEDDIAVTLDPLTGWGVGNRLLQRCLTDGLNPVYLEAERLRGDLPPGVLGERDLNLIAGRVKALVAAADRYRSVPPSSVDVDLRDGWPVGVGGTVGNVYGHRIVHVTYSSLAPKHRFAAWIDLLALTCARPDVPWEATVIGRDRDGAKIADIRAVDPDEAAGYLRDLLQIRAQGMREPLPLPPKTAAIWAEHIVRAGDRLTPSRVGAARRAAGGAWNTGFKFPGECDDANQRLVWGEGVSFEDLLAMPLRPGEGDPARNQDSRLGYYAVRMWEPELRHEGF